MDWRPTLELAKPQAILSLSSLGLASMSFEEERLKLSRLLDTAIFHGGQRWTHIASCNTLVSKLRILRTLAPEMKHFWVHDAETAVQHFQHLELAVSKAKSLLLACQSRSKIYMILRSDVVLSNFYEVAKHLERHLNKASGMYGSHMREAATLSLELRDLRFEVDEVDQSLSAIMWGLLKVRKRAPEQLCELAEDLGLRENKSIEVERERLQDDLEDARAEGDEGEVAFLHQLLQLLASIEAAVAASLANNLDGDRDCKSPRETSEGLQARRGVPCDLLCPLSGTLMTDPVMLCTGATFERASIIKWLDEGERVCPVTGKDLEHRTLTPNSTVKALSRSFRSCHSFPSMQPRCLPAASRDARGSRREYGCNEEAEQSFAAWVPNQQRAASFVKHQLNDGDVGIIPKEGVEVQDVAHLVRLLHEGSMEDRRSAAWELRQLTKYSPENRIMVAKAGAIIPLIQMLASCDSEGVENAITALLNLSIDLNNKVALMTAGAVKPITNVMKGGTLWSREAGAAVLGSLCIVNENKVTVGALGAIPLLIDLLRDGSTGGKKDAAGALLQLSIYRGNKKKIVCAGAVPPLVDLMSDPSSSAAELAVQVLASLVMIPEGCECVANEDESMTVLVDLLEMGSELGKQEAAAALLLLCKHSHALLHLFLQFGPIPALVRLSNSGTARSQRKALELLQIAREFRHQAEL